MTPNILKEEVEALEPFAKKADYADALSLDDAEYLECAPLLAGDYRRARDTIQSLRKAMEDTPDRFAEAIEAAAKVCDANAERARRHSMFPAYGLNTQAETADELATAIRNLTPDSAGSGWRPIETAPKDASLVLVCWPHRQFPDGWAYDVWAGDLLHENMADAGGVFDGAPHLRWKPTYWKPITPPAKEGEPT